ncbi:hypothetical protein [Sphingomonas sp. PAMC 26605]|uniref:hypothetical protein n=1 Tax=Sphingomonas sp. PAMC 26605 TaxID=1112214 RepID=UPI00026CA192|nr:hypothetical protein [Sphingomonas sp. PAMC 26605]
MLRFEIDFARIGALQDALIEAGLRAGVDQARAIRAFRVMLEGLFAGFNRRGVLDDGRAATLAEALESVDTPPRQRRGVALLRGLHLRSRIPLSDRVQRGRASPFAVDPHSYLFQLDDGPAEERGFPTMTSLGLYIDGYTEMRILWIGESQDYQSALAGLERETDGFSDWSTVYAPFDDWLRVGGA